MEPIIPVIDGKIALAMLAEAIKRKGSEHVYANPNSKCAGPAGCLYVHGSELIMEGRDKYGDPFCVEEARDDMEPGCIVGNALIGRGIPMEKFIDLKVNMDTPVDDLLAVFAEHGLIGSVHEAAGDAFRAAQTRQDQGGSWGQAYIDARNAAKMY